MPTNHILLVLNDILIIKLTKKMYKTQKQ